MDNNEQNTTPNGPIDTLRDGALKATIWENEGEHGAYLSTTFAKTYEDRDGNLRDGQGFTANELPRVSELARQAFARTKELRRELTQDRKQHQTQSSEQPSPAPRDNQSGRDQPAPRRDRQRARRSGPSQSY